MVLILCQIFKIILNISLKKHETLTRIPPLHVYINRFNNRLVFKMKDRYKLDTKAWNNEVICQHKQFIGKIKNWEIVPSFEVVEVALV